MCLYVYGVFYWSYKQLCCSAYMLCVPQLWCGIRIGHYSLLKFTWQRRTEQLNSHHCLLDFGRAVRFLSSNRWLLGHKVQCLDLAQGHSGPCWHSSEQTAPICRAGRTAHHMCVCVCVLLYSCIEVRKTCLYFLSYCSNLRSWVRVEGHEKAWKKITGVSAESWSGFYKESLDEET